VIGDADKVVVRWKWLGTHKAQFSTFPPTNKAITNEGMAIFRLKNRMITSTQLQTDRLGFLQALGVLPIDLTLNQNNQHNVNHVRFIDKFFVPAAAKQEFYERMRINRQFIKTLPGFVEDDAYEYTDSDGNLTCITIALWESNEALYNAKEAVQSEYRNRGFDPSEMFKRLKIVVDRGVYTKVVDH
jgi:heme-degrading monooxygenase HmoA